ncbi:MAG: flagellar filament capping protein FliD [Alphaproteobacteria bacterium]
MTGTDILSTINKTSGSGIDIASLVTNLVTAETELEQSNVAKDKAAIETKISELGKLSSGLSSLSGKLDGYQTTTQVSFSNTRPGNFQVEISDENLIEEAQFDIHVNQLAKSQIIHIDFAEGIAAASSVGTGTIDISFGTWSGESSKTFTSNGKTESVTIADGNNSLNDLIRSLNKIEGLQANLVSNGTSYSLIIRSDTGQDAGFRISGNVADPNAALASIDFDITGENSADLSKLTQLGQNAIIDIDGVTVQNNRNILDTTIAGAEITLLAPMATGDVANLSLTNDKDSVKASIKNLVQELNSLKTSMRELTKRGFNGEPSGPLAGDVRAAQISRELEKITTTPIEGFGDNIYLSQLGIRTELDGSLSFDESIFDRSLANPTIKNNYREIIFGIGLNADVPGLGINSSGQTVPSAGSYDYKIASNGNNEYSITLNEETFTATPNADGNIILRSTSDELSGLTFTLSQDILGSSSAGTFNIGVGFVPKFKDYIQSLIGPSGSIAKHTTTYEENLTDLETRAQDISDKKQALTDRYNLEFGKMESAISSLKRQGDYITSLMDMWTNYNK